MVRKFLILNVTTLGLLLSLSVNFCYSKNFNYPGSWKNQREDELHPSVISGIRTLEYIRRLIIDSSRNKNSIDQQFKSFDNQRYYPRFLNGAFKNGGRMENTHHPRRQVNSSMFEALSKLANVRVADPSIRQIFRDKNKNSNRKYLEGRLNRRQLHSSVEDKKNTSVRATVDPENYPKGDLLNNERPKIFNDSGLVTRKFQCSPISEIYIPNVDKQMPAYLCALGRRAFVILSDRFNQESRDRFIITLDDQTYRQLNPIHSGTSTLTSAVSVLPATLVLKRGDSDYTVREVKDNSKSVSATNRP